MSQNTALTSTALQINIIPLPVTMTRKIKNYQSKQIFGSHNKTTTKK